ncbi:hypothetical protein [Methylobacterium sp. Leaf102]|uniref:hypothetical protein n=1 Tax=Methylobacterium sp. Leaf102 TaxID=1736253 RepID=UPI000A5223F7|nr:hypothetical protein [Methylobacterium sp. Leaf102]
MDAPRSLAVVEFFADDQSVQWAETLEALDGRWTTVDRVLNSAPFKDILGIDIDPKTSIVSFENGDEISGRNLLQRILAAMAAPEFEFADIEDKDDRHKFVSKFADYNVKAAEGAPKWGFSSKSSYADPSTRSASSAEQGSPSPPENSEPNEPDRESQRAHSSSNRRQGADLNRKTLAPTGGPRSLHVQGIRLAPLYNECRRLVVKKNENAAALLVRVFIELSSEVYLEEKRVSIPPSLTSRSISEWSDHKVKLSEKVSAVIHSIDPLGKSPVFAQARMAIKNDAVGPFSLKMLHSYFHNHHVLPDETTVKASWDGWEAYLKALHASLNEPI